MARHDAPGDDRSAAAFMPWHDSLLICARGRGEQDPSILIQLGTSNTTKGGLKRPKSTEMRRLDYYE